MKNEIMAIFTRTPLHVGAGGSVGVVDSPIQRERHTRMPVIPGSGLKGVLADLWNEDLEMAGKELKRKKDSDVAKLFGQQKDEKRDTKDNAGGLLIGEARVLAFPVRSAKGAFAWITCPLALARYKRDSKKEFQIPAMPAEDECLASDENVKLNDCVILEEYKFKVVGDTDVWTHLKDLSDDEVWGNINERFVVVSDEIFSYFCENACEVVTRIKVDDESGTVADGALFNQEQAPSETMFYSVIGETESGLLDRLSAKLAENGNVIQVGGDATIGLGYCGVKL